MYKLLDKIHAACSAGPIFPKKTVSTIPVMIYPTWVITSGQAK